MKLNFLKKLLLFVLIVQWVPVQASGEMNFVRLVKNNSGTAPVLRLTDIHSQSLVLDDFMGNVTLVHFWATWCVPCIKEFPELQTISEKYRHKGLRVIAVAADSHELVREFVKARNVNLSVMVDQYGSAMRDYKVNALPSSYIIGKNGKLQFSATGPVNWSADDTSQLIEPLFASQY